MAELKNCASCGTIFAKTIRDICPACYKAEEEAFQKVYSFMMRKKNREAMIPEIVQSTGVSEELIIKFIKEKRLRASTFPNLSYPCERCAKPITDGRICDECKETISAAIRTEEELEAKKQKESNEPIYYAMESNKRR